MRSRIGRALALLLALVALVLTGAYTWLRTSLPATSGTIAIAGLSAPVKIYRDADGVPHIFASSALDGYRALGFLHAQDRLFQMDFTRRLAQGRLAEIVGRRALDQDRFMRTVGIYRKAQESLALLAPETRAALDAYAQGVNGYLAGQSGALPPEYQALRLLAPLDQPATLAPAPWTAADSAVWSRLMAMQLSGNWTEEARRARMAKTLTAQQIADLYLSDPADGGISLPKLDWASLDGLMERTLAAAPEPALPRRASNSWVVGSSRTASGSPILVNDPHLGFAAPTLWYLARIDAPDLSITGATVPGVPFHILGHNGHVAWGLTTTGADTQDLFVERLAAGDPARYDTPDGPKPFAVRSETVAVRGEPPVAFEVRETRHGPVISDLAGGRTRDVAQEGQVIALQAMFMVPDDRTADAYYRLNRAEDWKSFQAALRPYAGPMQNFAYADVSGAIGMIAPGRIPRRAGNADGFMPVPGWTGEGDWTTEIPFDQLPRRLDPPQGWIANANNRLVAPSYPLLITRDWDDSYRFDRIAAVLSNGSGRKIGDEAALLMDIVSPVAGELLPALLAARQDARPEGRPDARPTASPKVEEAKRLLGAWDRTMARNRAEPLIFAAWLRAVGRRLYGPLLGPELDGNWTPRLSVLSRMLRQDSAWCDDPKTPEREHCGALMNAALEDALAEIEVRQGSDMAAWTWGQDHQARHANLVLGSIPLIDRFANIVTPTDGGFDTINRAAYRAGTPGEPFADIHGAGYRAVYDLSDLDNSLFITATGQSGNLLSNHYRDLTGRWQAGIHRAIAGTQATLAGQGLDLLILEPK